MEKTGPFKCMERCAGVSNLNPRGGWGDVNARFWFVASHTPYTLEYGLGSTGRRPTTLASVAYEFHLRGIPHYRTALVKCALDSAAYSATAKRCEQHLGDLSGKTIIFDGGPFWRYRTEGRAMSIFTESVVATEDCGYVFVKPGSDPARAADDIIRIIKG